MADQEQAERLKRSVNEWNAWRQEHPGIRQPDLTNAHLFRSDLSGANLNEADFTSAILPFADLSRADLSGARLGRADLFEANLGRANLGGANLVGAYLGRANLVGADLNGAILSGARLGRANLVGVDLNGAILSGAYLSHTNLNGADLSSKSLNNVDFSGADLSQANLSGVNLGGADLSGAYLGGAILSGAYLGGADLSGAYLGGAILSRVTLVQADLNGADLSGANLNNVDFSGADLSSADLNGADLSGAILFDTNLRGAILSSTNINKTVFRSTIFAWVDLSSVKGLETSVYSGPSIVHINSVTLPHDEQTRLHFLRGVGFTETQIEYLPSLLTPRPIQYASLFISYASQDDTIAQRLHADLRKHDVPCWFAPHDLQPGSYFRERIDQAIHTQDKLLLLLSEDSVRSGWVRYEVELALSRENRQQREILFPLRLDDAIFDCTASWAASLQATRHIGDFTNWQDNVAYQQAFTALLRHLTKA